MVLYGGTPDTRKFIEVGNGHNFSYVVTTMRCNNQSIQHTNALIKTVIHVQILMYKLKKTTQYLQSLMGWMVYCDMI